ncbi:hypothetical protein C8R45DRAFT_941346 [Mycena sanguinolenta]|nr:hypothetical protein C8R45DRAFT_941346 [Mycena sanguinolenta]
MACGVQTRLVQTGLLIQNQLVGDQTGLLFSPMKMAQTGASTLIRAQIVHRQSWMFDQFNLCRPRASLVTHRRSKRAVAGLTIVDAISDGEDLDPDGGDTTVEAGVAGRASLLRNNENNHSAFSPRPVPHEAQPKVRGALEQQYLDQEVESKMHEFLPTFTEDGPVGNTLLSQNSLSSGAATALLWLPAHLSTPRTVITTIASHLRENIGRFTVSSSLEKAASEDDYKRIQDQTREEWLKVGGLLVGLAALEILVFALTPDSIFLVDGVVRITVSGSCISTSTGLLFNFYFYLRFALASIPVFKHRAQDNYQIRANGSIDRIESYVFFALIARLPLLLAMISIFFISILLAVAAYKLSPLVVLSILGLICLILFLQYLCWAMIWVGFGLVTPVGHLVTGLANAGMWVFSAPEYVIAKARELWRSLFNYKYLYNRS